MGEKGIKYYKRGPNREVRVGFFYHEIIIAVLTKNPKGLRLREIADKSRIPYNTVHRIINKLSRMNRVRSKSLKIYRGPAVEHYILNEWTLR